MSLSRQQEEREGRRVVTMRERLSKGKLVLCAAALGTALMLAACGGGVSKADYDKVVSERDAAVSELESTKAELEACKEKLKPYEEMTEAQAAAEKAKAEEESKKIKEKKAAEKAAKEKEAAEKAAEEEAAGYETGITYDQLARTPDDYKGKKVKFTGKVIQVIESADAIQIRLAVDDNYDTVLLGEYSPSIVSSRVLDDDHITIYGVSAGVVTYKSTLGGNITIPGVLIERIDQ